MRTFFKFCICFLAMNTLVSCSEDTSINYELESADKLDFITVVKSFVKPGYNNALSQNRNFGIWCRKNNPSSSQNQLEWVLNNNLVNYNNKNIVNFVLNHWINNAPSYDFFAYSPYSIDAEFVDDRIMISDYEVSTRQEEQTNILISTPVRSAIDFLKPVSIEFKSTMTNVNFEIQKRGIIKDATVYLNQLKINRVATKGTFKAKSVESTIKACGTWILESRRQDFHALLNQPLLIEEEAQPIKNLNQLYMLPQAIDVSIDLEFSINNQVFRRKNVLVEYNEKWNAGESKTYKIVLEMTEDDIINFETSVEGFDYN